MHKKAKIYVAGHKGLVGSAVVRKLVDKGYTNLVVRSHGDLDLKKPEDVEVFFKSERGDPGTDRAKNRYGDP